MCLHTRPQSVLGDIFSPYLGMPAFFLTPFWGFPPYGSPKTVLKRKRAPPSGEFKTSPTISSSNTGDIGDIDRRSVIVIDETPAITIGCDDID